MRKIRTMFGLTDIKPNILYARYINLHKMQVIMKKLGLLILALLFIPSFSWAQLGIQNNIFQFERMDTTLVKRFGITLKHPWGGGFNNGRFSQFDINFDGHPDLVVYDGYSESMKVYLNDGVPNQPAYTYAPEYGDKFPSELHSWVLLRDYNNDGLPDLFTQRVGGIALYKNTSNPQTGQISWQLMTHYLPAIIYGQMSGVYCSQIDMPAIDDINGDGKIDIIGPNVGGVTVYHYRNISTHPDTMLVERDNACWGAFAESAFNDSIWLNITCKGGGDNGDGKRNARHAGVQLSTLDISGNGLKDLLMGDVESSRLVALFNIGDTITAHMGSVTYNYPNNTVPVNMKEFNSSYYLDIDNDGKKDLIVTPGNINNSDDIDNVWFYKNNGQNNQPNFSYVRKNFLANNELDFGTNAHPRFVDVDGDGLLDMLVGNFGYFQRVDSNTFQAVYQGRMAYYRNTGDSINPEFTLVNPNFNGFANLNIEGFAPTFGDLDGDGDLDMVVGTAKGFTYYFENTAGPGNMMSFTLNDTDYFEINNGHNSTPTLYDVNGDSLLDLVIGEANGNLNYHPNLGTATSPFFNKTAVNTSFGGVQFFDPYKTGQVTCNFAKLDSTNTLYMLVGNQKGELWIYDGINATTLLSGNFNVVEKVETYQSHLSIGTGNINLTDSVEIVLGSGAGGIFIIGFPDPRGPIAPPTPTCNPPSALNAGAIDTTSATLNWTSGGANLSNVQWGTQGFGLGNGTIVRGITSNTYALANLTPNTQYQFYVQDSCDVNLNSNWVGPVSFRTDTVPIIKDTVGISSQFVIDDQNIRLFPNPTNQQLFLNVRMFQSRELNFEVYDVTGRVVLQRKERTVIGDNLFELPTHDLPGGVYILMIQSNEQSISRRFVKSNEIE